MTVLFWIAVVFAGLVVYGASAGVAFHLAGHLFPNEHDNDEQFLRGLASALWPAGLPVISALFAFIKTTEFLESRANRRAELREARTVEIPAPKLPEARIVSNRTPYDNFVKRHMR